MGAIERPSFSDEVEISVAGTTVSVDLIVSSRRGPPSGEAVLTSVQTLDGQDLATAMRALSDATATSAAVPSSLDGHRTTTIELITDPATLRPRRVVLIEELALTGTAADEASDMETRR